MSGLSSRVMNMKFMRSSDDNNLSSEQPQSQEEQHTKVKDTSEWGFKNAPKVLATNNSKKVQTVGYGSIHMFDEDDNHNGNDVDSIPKTIKRTWGQPAVDSETPALDFGSLKESGKKEPSIRKKPRSNRHDDDHKQFGNDKYDNGKQFGNDKYDNQVGNSNPQFGNDQIDNDNQSSESTKPNTESFLNSVFQGKKRRNSSHDTNTTKKPKIKNKRARMKN